MEPNNDELLNYMEALNTPSSELDQSHEFPLQPTRDSERLEYSLGSTGEYKQALSDDLRKFETRPTMTGWSVNTHNGQLPSTYLSLCTDHLRWSGQNQLADDYDNLTAWRQRQYPGTLPSLTNEWDITLMDFTKGIFDRLMIGEISQAQADIMWFQGSQHFRNE